MSSKLLEPLKPTVRFIRAALWSLYDVFRFYKHGGWRSRPSNKDERNYNVVKTYHALEKSMSFSERRPESGWDNAAILADLLKVASRTHNAGFQDKIGKQVLTNFVQQEGNQDLPQADFYRETLADLDFQSERPGGAELWSRSEFEQGVLKDPESFFFSRRSLREFDSQIVGNDVIHRAAALAMRSPSVCNRQAWHLYHTADDRVKSEALKLQSGNRGFGHAIPNLVILTVDLNAFVPGQERYQQWIDGGLFSMSFIYALHSLGVASCCLNWSQSPAVDMKLRRTVGIEDKHTVIMMLAVGYPRVSNSVCASARRPVSEVISTLKLRSEKR